MSSKHGDTDPETELLVERRLNAALVDRSRLTEDPETRRRKIREDLKRMEGWR